MSKATTPLTAAEERVLRHTFKAAMLRAAVIVENISTNDVLDMQAALLTTGTPLQDVARIDRAMVAVAHLRACAENGAGANEMVSA